MDRILLGVDEERVVLIVGSFIKSGGSRIG